ncbi:MAG TPA: DUF4127 family protein [Candidatus Baltobacteraceae bacterium]|nr:DUF4127 family protein [Candidatus Baltobacteraceae bacterium]
MIGAFAALLASIAFVPLDDRPVTAELPLMLGRIAGVHVDMPPPELIGHYLTQGRPDSIVVWLNQRSSDKATRAFVVSSDMLAYGGLLASRVPGVTYTDAYFRLKELAHLRAKRPDAWIATFGTVMRLAPTGVPSTAAYFAPYPVWSYLQQYANLHDPPLPNEAARAAHLRSLIGDATFDAYIATRARNLEVDRLLLGMAADGTIDRLVLGQDDAGPVGLHVREVTWLQSVVAQDPAMAQRASIEPGADELGMALVAHALAREAQWVPRVAVRYSTPNGASFQDPLEFAPISSAIEGLVRLCGGVLDDDRPDVTLFVRIPRTTVVQDDAFADAMTSDVNAGGSVALADLSYLASYSSQAAFAERILASGTAAKLDAYSSWNTNANTVGTALAEAVAAGAGRRMHTYDALAHRTFTFVRFVDDYAYHDFVRPDLNGNLDAQGVTDHTLLPPQTAAASAGRDRALLWNRAAAILAQLYPGYHIAALSIGLPWDRTFETSVDVGIAPDL